MRKSDKTMFGGSGIALAAGVVALAMLTGCTRTMTVQQQGFINNAMHSYRDEASRTGDPLELAIVMVTPDDLELEANGRLDPRNQITSDIWFEDRPQLGDSKDTGVRFWLPKDQVLVFCDTADKVFGKRVGDRLAGATPGKTVSQTVEFEFPGPAKDSKSVIYVFPKFVDEDGRVLPVTPARFHPPGGDDSLAVRIGSASGRGVKGQYIEVVSNYSAD